MKRERGIGALLGRLVPFLEGASLEIRSRSGRVKATFSGPVPFPIPALGDRHEVRNAFLDAEVAGESVVIHACVVELASTVKRAGFSVWGGSRKLLVTLVRHGLASGVLRRVEWPGGAEGELPARIYFS